MIIIGKIRIRFRFFMFLAICILGLILLFGTKGNPVVAFVQWGEMKSTYQMDAIIIRDEELIESEEYGKVTYLVPEGQRVVKGQQIATLYTLGYDQEVIDERNMLQQKIKDYQEKNILQDIVNKDLKKFNQDIAEKAENIYTFVQSGARDDLLYQDQQLKNLMQERQEYLERTIKADEYLQRLYEQKEKLDEKIDKWKIDITAGDSGVVSFCFDGCEMLLSPDRLKDLTPEDVDNILKNAKIQKAKEAQAFRPLYRLVNNHNWYVIIVDRENRQLLQNKGTYDLLFEGYHDDSFRGKVIQSKRNKKDMYYVMEMKEEIGPLLNVRKGKITIDNTFEGLKVPVKGIKKRDGEEGIIRFEQGKRVFVPVEVMIKDKEYAIVKPKDTESLKVNQQIIIK